MWVHLEDETFFLGAVPLHKFKVSVILLCSFYSTGNTKADADPVAIINNDCGYLLSLPLWELQPMENLDVAMIDTDDVYTPNLSPWPVLALVP